MVPAAEAGAAGGERLLRALVSLVDDLTVERDEPGLLRAAVEHAVGSLGLVGGAAMVVGEDGAPRAAAAHRLNPEDEEVRDLARTVLAGQLPLVRPLSEGGWLAATPLRARQRTLGALVLHGDAASGSPLGNDALEVLGKQVGTGLENVRLYAELREAAGRAEVLRRITTAVTSGSELASVLPAVAAEVRAVIAAERVACGFVNESGDYIETVSDPEGSCWGLGGVLPVVGSGPGFVALNDRAVVQRDLVQDHRFLEDMRLLEDGLRSYLLLPLRAREQAIGVLALGSRTVGAYDDATLARLQPLADAVALAFENLRLLQKTRELSITDEVTPLHNFRHFHTALDRELKLAQRHGGPLSLLFIDLDHFKPINDSYGHLRGSRTLREVGFLIREAVRETDIPARYGGDEFVVVLPHTESAAARTLAEKLRQLIEGHTFLQEESINARLGVSLGIATFPDDATTKEALIRLADQRMYQDKDLRKAGR
ncbi:MAG TPA: diguanylate cyclase [Vicinamibacteria bacterium]|nr:diguanylate cyclase [Vicinamibacteria bacterium]